ncbi:MAG TPA: hypothetical protein VIJ39_12645 [Solirubrobacteraceae bacterium]
MLTSVANVAGVVLIGVGLAVRVLPGETNLALTLLLATIASAGLHRRPDRNEASGSSSRRSMLALKALVAVADGGQLERHLGRFGNSRRKRRRT